MDVVHRGQPGEEQYGDISSVGEWESGQAHKYGHIKCEAYSSRAHCALQQPYKCVFDTVVNIALFGAQYSEQEHAVHVQALLVRPQFLSSFPCLSLANPPRHPHGQSKYQECQARSNGVFSPQGAPPPHLHTPCGEDTDFLLDSARPSGSQHAVCGNCSPQPAPLAVQLPL